MKTDIFYYFVSDFCTGAKKTITTDHWLGDIGEMIVYNEIVYIVEDYAWEFYDTEDMKDMVH